MSHFRLQFFNKHGKLYAERVVKNTITAEGLKAFLDVLMPPRTSVAFFVGIYDSGGPIIVSSTGGSPGFTEFTDYTAPSSSVRPTRQTSVPRIAPANDFEDNLIPDGIAVSRARNGSAFLFTAAGSIKGAFWSTEQIKANGLGTLLGGADFSDSPVAVKIGDSLNAFYTITSEASDSIGAP